MYAGYACQHGMNVERNKRKFSWTNIINTKATEVKAAKADIRKTTEINLYSLS